MFVLLVDERNPIRSSSDEFFAMRIVLESEFKQYRMISWINFLTIFTHFVVIR